MSMWSAFAVFVATAWERLSQRWQFLGAAFVGIVGAGAGLLALFPPNLVRAIENEASSWTTWDAVQGLPPATSQTLRPMMIVISFSLILAVLIATNLATRNRPRLSLSVLAAAMVPITLSLADGIGRMSPQFSLADTARYLKTRLNDNDAVVYEGELDDASSLVFYLARRFYLVNEPADDEMHIAGGVNVSTEEGTILRRWGDPQAIYLIIKQDRAAYWQQVLTARFHIYHQVMSSGRWVVVSNQL